MVSIVPIHDASRAGYPYDLSKGKVAQPGTSEERLTFLQQCAKGLSRRNEIPYEEDTP